MPMDGRYDARSHGGGAVMYRMYGMSRCHGWQGATNAHGCTLCPGTVALAVISPAGRDHRPGAYRRIFHVGELSEVTRLCFNSHSQASSAS